MVSGYRDLPPLSTAPPIPWCTRSGIFDSSRVAAVMTAGATASLFGPPLGVVAALVMACLVGGYAWRVVCGNSPVALFFATYPFLSVAFTGLLFRANGAHAITPGEFAVSCLLTGIDGLGFYLTLGVTLGFLRSWGHRSTFEDVDRVLIIGGFLMFALAVAWLPMGSFGGFGDGRGELALFERREKAHLATSAQMSMTALLWLGAASVLLGIFRLGARRLFLQRVAEGRFPSWRIATSTPAGCAELPVLYRGAVQTSEYLMFLAEPDAIPRAVALVARGPS